MKILIHWPHPNLTRRRNETWLVSRNCSRSLNGLGAGHPSDNDSRGELCPSKFAGSGIQLNTKREGDTVFSVKHCAGTGTLALGPVRFWPFWHQGWCWARCWLTADRCRRPAGTIRATETLKHPFLQDPRGTPVPVRRGGPRLGRSRDSCLKNLGQLRPIARGSRPGIPLSGGTHGRYDDRKQQPLRPIWDVMLGADGARLRTRLC